MLLGCPIWGGKNKNYMMYSATTPPEAFIEVAANVALHVPRPPAWSSGTTVKQRRLAGGVKSVLQVADVEVVLRSEVVGEEASGRLTLERISSEETAFLLAIAIISAREKLGRADIIEEECHFQTHLDDYFLRKAPLPPSHHARTVLLRKEISRRTQQENHLIALSLKTALQPRCTALEETFLTERNQIMCAAEFLFEVTLPYAMQYSEVIIKEVSARPMILEAKLEDAKRLLSEASSRKRVEIREISIREAIEAKESISLALLTTELIGILGVEAILEHEIHLFSSLLLQHRCAVWRDSRKKFSSNLRTQHESFKSEIREHCSTLLITLRDKEHTTRDTIYKEEGIDRAGLFQKGSASFCIAQRKSLRLVRKVENLQRQGVRLLEQHDASRDGLVEEEEVRRQQLHSAHLRNSSFIVFDVQNKRRIEAADALLSNHEASSTHTLTIIEATLRGQISREEGVHMRETVRLCKRQSLRLRESEVYR